jgi:GTP cyclohydrolase IA
VSASYLAVGNANGASGLDDAGPEAALERNIAEFLRLLGEEPSREGLSETPRRVRAAWQEWTDGYGVDAVLLVKTFEQPSASTGDMVVVRDIPVYSHCEHHLAPFFGKASIAYLPNGRIVGLSKLPRIVEVFARRLQVQERMTHQIADTLDMALQPLGVGVVVECRHMCMESRGVFCQGSSTTTATFRGLLRTEPGMRTEFMTRTR